MRKCVRCGAEMMDNLKVRVDGMGADIRIAEKGFFGSTVGYVVAAVCPKCGEVSLYIPEVTEEQS